MKNDKKRPGGEFARTPNRSVYNKIKKQRHAINGDIKCSRCKYHRGDNETRKWYGDKLVKFDSKSQLRFRYPSWKLVSKKRKQWMDGTYRVKEFESCFSKFRYVRFRF